MAKWLTKSEYMLYLRHPAWLWLKKHDKIKLPPIDDRTEAMFDGGHDFDKMRWWITQTKN